ncbi:MAG: type I DNA topoisomerase [Polyangiaceae bacterium]|nr:type I DNA topoisomerase [Polyangiaceae bacterium]
MGQTLVIVESPAKAKTIKKYLGSHFEVLASNGHVKDLPKKLGVDVKNDFTETYVVIEGKAKVLNLLKSAAKKADNVLIATDPDREGEAIAFHILEELEGHDRVERVEFHEITKKGIQHGVEHPRELDANLYSAQRARRVLDRIVGYDVSALVWSKLAFGLSAGRVQSVALRLIVDREREVEAFQPVEYWLVSTTVAAAGPNGSPGGTPFLAKLASADGAKLEIGDGVTASAVRADLETARYALGKVTRREQKRNPSAPFTTSRLQQSASNYLHMPASRTMRTAQSLYEGVDLKRDGGPVGLITYVRTDSTRVAAEAITEVREFIAERFGAAALPDKPNVYRSGKRAQDAHEAIRPTSVALHPEAVRKHLKPDQYRLYKLIWNRFVASQMAPAVYDRTSFDVEASASRPDRLHASYLLRATGRVLKSPGWLQIDTDGPDTTAADEGGEGASASESPADEAGAGPSAERGEPDGGAEREPAADDDGEALLPSLDEGQALVLVTPPGVVTDQKFTQPPPRYNEGSLVRELEKRGIGRPSTYAEIISKVQARAYVQKLEGGAFQPTDLGKAVVDGLVKSELDIMDPGFTAQMEEELDEVGAGKLKRVELLRRFYKRFSAQLEVSKKKKAWKPEPEPTSEVCEECGSMMLKRWSKNGWFLGCSAYPKCKTTRDLGGNGQASPVRETDIVCDKCGRPMVIKNGRFGEFLSCTGYPKCKNARPVPLGVPCPKCGGDLIEIRSKKGRSFYGCSNYSAEQKCDFKLWNRPIPGPCPACGAPILTRVKGKNPMIACADKACGYKRPADEERAAPAPAPLPATPSAPSAP